METSREMEVFFAGKIMYRPWLPWQCSQRVDLVIVQYVSLPDVGYVRFKHFYSSNIAIENGRK